VETLEYLHDRHLTGLSRKAAVNRLGDLVAHGYLVRVPITGHDGQYAGVGCCVTAAVTAAEC
jgi:hypothetical protein